MIQKVKKTIEQHHMLDQGDSVIIALSGGADSCALLSVLCELKKDYDLKLIAAHFNHGLRGQESDQEENFCRKLSEQYGIQFVSETMDSNHIPQGQSPEDYYRNNRYRFLEQAAVMHHVEKIALGHHACDQAETVLLNLLRGSGMDGLKGILPIRDNRYIRPLIERSRQEIIDYLTGKGLHYCFDSSNLSPDYSRNRIRMELLPFIKEKFNPQVEQTLARTARIFKRDSEYLDATVQHLLNSEILTQNSGQISFMSGYFLRLHEAIQYRLIKAILEKLSPEGKGIYYSHIQSVVDLVQTLPTGKEISLPFGLKALKQYDRIFIKKEKSADKPEYQYTLSIPGTIDLKERGVIISAELGLMNDVRHDEKTNIYMDMENIHGALTVRNRRKGDWFVPLGSQGRQKIKKVFIDHKIPRDQRSQKILLADEVSVLWIENLHLCERVKISPQTKNVLVITFRQSS